MLRMKSTRSEICVSHRAASTTLLLLFVVGGPLAGIAAAEEVAGLMSESAIPDNYTMTDLSSLAVPDTAAEGAQAVAGTPSEEEPRVATAPAQRSRRSRT